MPDKHKVCINVTDRNGNKEPVLESRVENIPKRLFDSLFKKRVAVVVLTPGDSVDSINIYEITGKEVQAND